MVVGDASFVNDLGMDSLALYELIVALEGEFDIEIPDADAEKITTVTQAIDYVQVKLFNVGQWGFGDPNSPVKIKTVVVTREVPWNVPRTGFNFHSIGGGINSTYSVGYGSNEIFNLHDISDDDNQNDCKDPLKPPYLTCDEWMLMNGHGFLNWLKQQNSFRVYKPESWLDSQAVNSGMTVANYLTERINLIVNSMDGPQVKALGKSIRTLGYIGTAFSGYKLMTAISDGNITTRDVLSGVSFTLSVITLVPGVGTVIGVGGSVLLGVGSMVFGIASDNVDDSVLIDFKSR